jgi:hypothetical protein
MPPSGVNDTIRELMAQIRTWYENAQWVDLGLTHTRVSGSVFTLAGNYVATYEVGRRVKMTGSSTAYGTISASTYSAPTTTITVYEANVPVTLGAVALSILSPTGGGLPTQFTVGPTDFTGGNVRVTDDIAHASGAGLELAYDAATTTGTLQAYDRTAAAARALVLNGSGISLRVNGVDVGYWDATGSLGVGTTAPVFGSGTGVEVQRAGIATVRLENTSASNSFELYVDSAASGVNLRGRDSSPMNLWTANVIRVSVSEQGPVTLTNAAPLGAILSFVDSSAAADNGRWRLRNVGETFVLQAYDDADTTQVNAIEVERTGTVIDSVTIAKRLNFGTHTTSTSASAGGASALPATPSGYVTVQVNGSNKKIPYYD